MKSANKDNLTCDKQSDRQTDTGR